PRSGSPRPADPTPWTRRRTTTPTPRGTSPPPGRRSHDRPRAHPTFHAGSGRARGHSLPSLPQPHRSCFNLPRPRHLQPGRRLVNAAIGPRARDDELSVRWVRIDPQPGVVGNVGAGAHLLSPDRVMGGSWGGQRQWLGRFVVVERDPEATRPLLAA